jgi:hypothetical protein
MKGLTFGLCFPTHIPANLNGVRPIGKVFHFS